MTNTLLTAICRDLGIPATAQPEEAAGYAVWSGTGRTMLTALWDTRGKEQTVSVQHCKRAGLRFLETVAALCPDGDKYMPSNPEEAVDEIYRIYRRNGLLYQQEDRCAPAMAASAGNGKVRLRRGISPMEPAIMSGLGFLDRTPKVTNSIPELFQLQTTPLDRYLEEVKQDAPFTPWRYWEVGAEYLRMDRNPRMYFWKDTLDVYSDITMARYRKNGRRRYVLCRVKGFSSDAVEMPIPAWRLLDPRMDEDEEESLEYLRLANALMLGWETRPAIRYTPLWDGKAEPTRYQVDLRFPLPPTEQDFFTLYSWPSRPRELTHTQNRLNRIMHPDVFNIFRSLLQPLGYTFMQL